MSSREKSIQSEQTASKLKTSPGVQNLCGRKTFFGGNDRDGGGPPSHDGRNEGEVKSHDVPPIPSVSRLLLTVVQKSLQTDRQ